MAQIALYGKSMHRTITCLNGRFQRADRAVLPIADRGFRFGDGVFETIPLTQGIPYLWDEHIARLAEGLAALKISPLTVDFAAIAKKLIRKNRAKEGFLRLSVSRGIGSQGYLPQPGIAANWAMEYLPALPLPANPCNLWLGTYRRSPLSALPGNQKIAQGITSTLAMLEATANDADEALLLSAEGDLCSAASANLFWIEGDRIYTPPLSTGCLDGTIRRVLFTLLPHEEIQEKTATIDALENADAAFLTNSRYGIWPVAMLQPQTKIFDSNHPLIREFKGALESKKLNYDSAAWNSHS